MSLEKQQVHGVVMAHGAVADTVRRHLPYWLKVCDTVTVWVPEGEAFDLPGATVIDAIPNAGPYTPNTSRRFRVAMESASHSGYRYTLLMEYDSLCWGPIPEQAIPDFGCLGACLFPNEKRSPIPGLTFHAPFYLHFPHLYSRHGLMLTCAAMDQIPDDSEHGYTDRYLGLAVHVAELPVINYREMGLAYSWERISGHDHRIVECMEAVKNGAIFSHGIKDEAALRRIMAVAPFGQP